MQTILEIIQDKDSDRVIILHRDESRCKEYADGIVGLNFHQGDYHIDVTPQFLKINPHLTEIWRRLSLGYPNVPYMVLIDKAVDLFVDAFISQNIFKED